MRPRRAFLVCAAIAAAALVGIAGPAHAGPPGTWTTISGPGIDFHVQPGLHRTADGTLHVAITEKPGATSSIEVAHVSASGKLTGRSAAVTGWADQTIEPALVGAPDGGLRLVFGGIATSTATDPYSQGYAYTASSDASGALWTLAPDTTPAIKSPTAYSTYGTGATTLADGTLVAAYALNSTITYQVGNGAPASFTVPECCAFSLSLVNDGGAVWAAWWGNGGTAAGQGIFARQLYPALGPVLLAPGSVTDGHSIGPGQQVAIAARAGGGVYLAYLRGWKKAKDLALWRVGDAKAMVVRHSKAASRVALSAGEGGRLWLVYDDGVFHQLHVAQTDPAAKRLGAVQLVKPPKGSTVYDLGIEGSSDHADIVFNDGTAILHTQARYGLSVKASPGVLKAGKPGKVTFTVTDAGDSVKGAKVKTKGRSCRTDKKGKCSITFPALPAGGFDARASAKTYAKGSVHLKVKH